MSEEYSFKQETSKKIFGYSFNDNFIYKSTMPFYPIGILRFFFMNFIQPEKK